MRAHAVRCVATSTRWRVRRAYGSRRCASGASAQPHATPRCVQPRHATLTLTPLHATSRHFTPLHSTPRHATPRHATPRHAVLRMFRRDEFQHVALVTLARTSSLPARRPHSLEVHGDLFQVSDGPRCRPSDLAAVPGRRASAAASWRPDKDAQASLDSEYGGAAGRAHCCCWEAVDGGPCASITGSVWLVPLAARVTAQT